MPSLKTIVRTSVIAVLAVGAAMRVRVIRQQVLGIQ